jgi:hypothetical protein
MDRLLIAIFVISSVFFAVTYVLHRFFSKRKFVKYLPAVLSLVFVVINIVLARSSYGEGFRGLAYLLMAIILFFGFTSGLLSALFLDFILPRIKKKGEE